MPELDSAEKTRILVVDDSKLMRKSAVKMLGEQFDVVVANDGEEGWEIIQADTSISVVFTDLNMPKLDGYELLSQVRQSNDSGIQNLPVIVVTGAEDESSAKEKAFDNGATDFISKPFNSTEIKARACAHANYQRDKQILEKLSDRDVLTGTLSRQAFISQLDKDISSASRHDEQLAIITLEIANFKQLFIKIGKQGADSIVNHVAKLLKKSIRTEDSVGRIGVAKFSLSLPKAKQDNIVELAERLVQSICRFKITLRGEPLLISANMSVCCIQQGQKPDSHYVLDQSESLVGVAENSSHINFLSEEAISEDAKQDSVITADLEAINNSVPSSESDKESDPAEVKEPLSIDYVISSLLSDTSQASNINFNDVINQLQPVFKHLSHLQKDSLITQLQAGDDQVNE